MRSFLKRIGSPSELVAELRRDGWKTVLKRRGLALLVVVFLYYLIRDSILYIILPLLAARGFLSGLKSLF